MLVLGGAAVLNSLTAVNIYVAAFLIPIGVIIYTFFGGLKATFLAEYLNTVFFLFTLVLVFVVAVYFLNPQIGGISGIFAKLMDVAVTKSVEGNFAGSYLTMASSDSLVLE
jgi:Na+/proline symporter